MTKKLETLLVKPAGPDCNLRCAYCFYYDKGGMFPAGPHRMTDETLAEMVRNAGRTAEGVLAYGWQGGEPTLMGLPFFERAMDLQRRHTPRARCMNGLQTNGLLLDEQWAEFLKREGFLVGLSLDGPEHVHDHYRRFADGRGSFERVRDRARMLLDNGVQVNALAVVNDYSAGFAAETYGSLKELGLTFMQFIPCLEADPERPGKPAPYSVSAPAWGEFLSTAFDLWIGDFKNGTPSTSVRYFDSLFYRYVGLEPPDCTLREECGIYLAVEHNGDVYSCDFYVDPAHRLGNVATDELSELLNSAAQRSFGRSKGRLSAECGGCEWLNYCRGGCLKERGFGREPRRRSDFCAAYKKFFAHAHQRLVELGARWRAEHASELPPPDAAPSKPGRNEPCPCGSGKKFKNCCGK